MDARAVVWVGLIGAIGLINPMGWGLVAAAPPKQPAQAETQGVKAPYDASGQTPRLQGLWSPDPAPQRLVQVLPPVLRLHAQPDAGSEIVAQVARGQLLTWLREVQGWAAVDLGGGRIGWVPPAPSPDAPLLQALAGPGPARFARDETGAAGPGDAPGSSPHKAAAAQRPGRAPNLVTLPPLEPGRITAPHPRSAPVPDALPDRWRLMQTLGLRYPLYDPYNQNVLKGDLPVLQHLAPDLFFNLGVVSDNLIEHRQVPTPVAAVVSRQPGALDIAGRPQQSVQAHTLLLSLGLTQGNTTFKPPDFELRFAPAFQFNRVQVGEAGALFIDPTRGTERRHQAFGVQELFLDVHLRNVSSRYDFDSLRVGIQPFSTDFRGFLFNDLPLGIRLFGNRDNNLLQYNLALFRRLEKDTNSGLNDIGRSPRHDDVASATVFRQDFPVLGLTSQWSLTHNRNQERGDHYDTNGFLVRPAVLGDLRGRGYRVTYLGYSADGHLGLLWPQARLNLSTSTYLALGRDERSPLAGRPQSIRAFLHASEVSRDFSWLRLRGSLLLASGDRNPHDGRATGFDAIFENPLFAGADTSYFIRQSIPLIGGGGVALSGRNGLLPSLRSSKEQGQSNFQNPGLLLLGLGADVDLTPTCRVLMNASHLRFAHTAVLGALRNEAPPDRALGWDLSLGVQWRPFFNQNVVINGSVAVLKFGSGLRQFYGAQQDRAHSALLNALFTY